MARRIQYICCQREICLLHKDRTEKCTVVFSIIVFSGTGSKEFKLKDGKSDLSSDSKSSLRFSSTL